MTEGRFVSYLRVAILVLDEHCNTFAGERELKNIFEEDS
jgi:hypothetical protein